MSDSLDNIKAMLRRAMASEMELGYDDVVLSRPTDEIVATASREALPESQLGKPTYNSLDEHYKDICTCLKCPLGHSRNKFVYGVGHPSARLMFIGEGPGADEDRLGEPFVGRAGKLLDKILAAMQLTRDQVYIANIVKCRPPNNRDPLPEEMDACTPYLHEQIRLIRPQIICALGRVAAQSLLSTTTPLGKLRGQWHEYEGVPLLVTYHPAALLRSPNFKRPTWEDMQMIMARLGTLR